MGRVELIISSGGLGPTQDDLTRETVADLLGRRLQRDEKIVQYIQGRFRSLGREMPELNIRQAMVPEGAEVLENPRGTAPGLWIEDSGHFIALLPGPPRELQPLFDASMCCRGWSAALSGVRLFQRQLRVTGLGESHVEQRILPIYSRYADVNTTFWPRRAKFRFICGLWTADAEQAKKTLDEIVQGFEIALTDRIFSARWPLAGRSGGARTDC